MLEESEVLREVHSQKLSSIPESLLEPDSPATKSLQLFPQRAFKMGLRHYSLYQFRTAIEFFKLADEGRYPLAILYMGLALSAGHGICQDLQLASVYSIRLKANLDWFNKIEDEGVRYNYFGLMHEGLLKPINLYAAAQYYKRSADLGNADGQNNLGICFQYGIGLEKDPTLALHSYRKAAAQKHADAHYNIGLCFHLGQGVDKDVNKMVEHFQQAAAQGHVKAQNSLAICYLTGRWVVKDIKMGLRFLYKAVDEGHADAQNNLGFCYQYGIGMHQNLEQAFRYYQQAALQGLEDAQYAVGLCYYGGRGVAKDFIKAISYFAMAAVQGRADALNQLGLCYLHGLGVKININLAAGFFLLAAEKNDALAQLNLANCYKNGIGFASNIKLAVYWYHRAATGGNTLAQNTMGHIYQEGSYGVKVNSTNALYYFHKAASQGDQSAIKSFEKIARIPHQKYTAKQREIGRDLVNCGIFGRKEKNPVPYDIVHEYLDDPRDIVLQERVNIKFQHSNQVNTKKERKHVPEYLPPMSFVKSPSCTIL